MLDGVITVSDHELAGGARFAVADAFGVAPKRADIVEDPFVMAALLVHVREQRFLIGEIRRSRRRRREQRERVPHVMIGLREKIQIHRARRAAAHDLANERDCLEPLAFGRGVRD